MSLNCEVLQSLSEGEVAHDEFGVSRLVELLKTAEGRAEFKRGIERGMETYARIKRTERPVSQRPEWMVPDHPAKIYR